MLNFEHVEAGCPTYSTFLISSTVQCHSRVNTIDIAKERKVARRRKIGEKKEVSTKATAEVGAIREDVNNSAIESEQEKRKIPYKKRFKTTR